MSQQSKTGRHFRWYANGLTIGLSLVKSLKPDRSMPLESVVQCGNGDVFEYAQKVQETSLTLDYTLISYDQLAKAMGQTVANEIPDLPQNVDIVEKMIVAGTEGNSNETAQGYAFYGRVQFEKESFDIEADKLVSVNLTAKCKKPRRYPGANGIQYDKFTGNGVTSTFALTKNSVRQGADGYWTIRGEYPLGTALTEGQDYTVNASNFAAGSNNTIASTASASFSNGVVPASSATPNVMFIYAY